MSISTQARLLAGLVAAAAVAAPAALATDDGTLLSRAAAGARHALEPSSAMPIPGARYRAQKRVAKRTRAEVVRDRAYRAAYEVYRRQLGLPPLPLPPGSYIGHPGGPGSAGYVPGP